MALDSRRGEIRTAPGEPAAQRIAVDVRNTVAAAVMSGSVVQADSIGAVEVHHHPGEPSWPAPRQLPAAPIGFVGRGEELAELSAAVGQTGMGVVVSALGGAGGIGKTWLALHWAHAHKHLFPDGQLFVDLQGFSPAGQPLAPAVAVRGFLDALGVAPARIPTDLQAQTALYRSLVAGRRMLLVLDNVATTEQVLPLLPGGPGCTVLVTSRRRLTGLVAANSARPLHLDVLSAPEARRLLTTSLGAGRSAADPVSVEALLAVCAGFPLALAIVAARARTNPRLPLTVLAAELRADATRLDALDSDDPTASLPAVLSWSLRALTDEQREAFALLGIAPGPTIGPHAAAALLDLPAARARRVLTALQDASLLDSDSHGRCCMHDLVRAYATHTATQFPGGIREAAVQRVLDHHTHSAYTADRLLYPFRDALEPPPPARGARPRSLPDAVAALAWFEAEHACLLASQRTATVHRHHPTTWHLAWALDTFHTLQGHSHDRLSVWQAALQAAPHLRDPGTLSRTHRYLGDAHNDLGHHHDALTHFHQALTHSENPTDSTHRAHTHYGLSWVWAQQDDHRQALHHARRALHLFQDAGNPVWDAMAHSAVGWHGARNGDHDTARAHCQTALTLLRDHHHPNGVAEVHDTLGYIDHHTGHHTSAIDHYDQALVHYRDLGNTYDIAGTLERLGDPHAALGHHDQARDAWREALHLYRGQARHDHADRIRQQLDDLDCTCRQSQPTCRCAGLSNTPDSEVFL